MTLDELIKILQRYDPVMPVMLADPDGAFDANPFDIQVISSATAPNGLALCISPHDRFYVRPVRQEVKCPGCGWVHVAIPRHHAEQSVRDANADLLHVGGQPVETLDGYLRCFRCGADASTFIAAHPGDAPTGCTLQSVVID